MMVMMVMFRLMMMATGSVIKKPKARGFIGKVTDLIWATDDTKIQRRLVKALAEGKNEFKCALRALKKHDGPTRTTSYYSAEEDAEFRAALLAAFHAAKQAEAADAAEAAQPTKPAGEKTEQKAASSKPKKATAPFVDSTNIQQGPSPTVTLTPRSHTKTTKVAIPPEAVAQDELKPEPEWEPSPEPGELSPFIGTKIIRSNRKPQRRVAHK